MTIQVWHNGEYADATPEFEKTVLNIEAELAGKPLPYPEMAEPKPLPEVDFEKLDAVICEIAIKNCEWVPEA